MTLSPKGHFLRCFKMYSQLSFIFSISKLRLQKIFHLHYFTKLGCLLLNESMVRSVLDYC